MAGSIANLSASLRWDIDDFQRGTASIEGAFKNIIGLAGDVADAVANAGRRMTIGLSVPIAGIAALTTKAASDAAELQSAFDYTFGAMSARMNRWAEESGDAMGRATGEMQEGALRFGQLFKAAAPTEEAAARLSQRFTELAQDAASFYNTDFDTAMGKIRSGLTGESEPLRDFGVFLNEAAVEAKALEMGLINNGQELNEYGKVMARSALIAEGLADAQGDVERTSSSLANRIRKIKGDIRELATEIGKKLEPYAQRLAGVIERLVAWFRNLPDGVKDAAIGFGVFLAALGPVSIILSALAVTVLPLFLVRMGGIFAVISAIVNPLGTALVFLGKWITSWGGIVSIISKVGPVLLRFLGPVGLVITALQMFGDDILRGLRAFFDFVSKAIGDGLRGLFASLGDTVERVRDALDRFMESPVGRFLAEAADFVGMLLEAFITLAGYLTGELITAVFEVLTFLADIIGGVIETAVKLLTGDWVGAWDAAVQTVGRAIIRIGQWIKNIWPWLGGMIEMLGKLTGAEISSPKAPTGNAWADAPVVDRSGANDNGDTFARGDYAAGDPKKTRKARSGRNRSGPTAEELQERREAIKLEQDLSVAREKGDQAAIRSLERKRDLQDRIEQYERAGLNLAQAKSAAEADMVELDQARARALKTYLEERQVETEYQVAILHNDYEHMRFLEREREMQDRINDLVREGVDLVDAERTAAAELLGIDQAREASIARRLRQQEQAHELELARLRGDSDASIRAREEGMRVEDRIDELMDRGEMSRADAEAQAMREAADRSQAHVQGTFRDAFRGGLRAALDGNLGDFFEGWLKERSFNALSKVLDRLADSLANLVSGGGQGGGLFSILGSALGVVSGSPASGVGSAAVTGGGWQIKPEFGPMKIPGFATGGRGKVKGHPGIDKNLVSINGNPAFRVSSGEILNVQRGDNHNGRQVVEIVDTTGLFKFRSQQYATEVAAPMAVQAAGAGSAGAQMSLLRSQKRSMNR